MAFCWSQIVIFLEKLDGTWRRTYEGPLKVNSNLKLIARSDWVIVQFSVPLQFPIDMPSSVWQTINVLFIFRISNIILGLSMEW